MSNNNPDHEANDRFPRDVPLLHGPITPEEQKAEEERQRREAYDAAEHAFKERQVNAVEASNKLSSRGIIVSGITAFIAMFACIGTFYQGCMNRRSWETAQHTLNQMRQDASASSQQFQVQLQHFDAGLGRTGLLAEHSGKQAVASQRAANAAKSAADTAKSALTTSQGAYVTIGRKDGVVAEFVTSKDHPDENVPLIVYFQNTGHIPAMVAWDTSDRKDGTLESFGIHRFTTGMGRTPLPPSMLGKNGEFYEAVGRVIAGESVGRNELAYISQSDLEKLSKKIVCFYVDGFYAYCDQLGTWSTHQFTLNYHTDMPIDLRFELISDIEIANTPIPKSIGGKSYFPPCTSTVVMSQTQQYASRKAK